MTARHLASAVLACLLALFAHDQGGGVVTISIVTGAAMFARFVAYPLICGGQPSGGARRVMNASLVVGLWVGGLMMLATDWIPKNGFLPLAVLGGVWMLLDRPATRLLDTCFIGVSALAAIVVFSAIDEPDVVAVPLAGSVGLMLIIAFGMLDRARIVEALGGTRLRKPIKLDTWAVLVLLLICAPVAWVLPVPGSAREEAREKWRQGLDSIAGFSDRIDLARLGLLKSNDNGALVVTVREVEKDADEVSGWRDLKMWRNDDEMTPNRHPLLLRGAALARWNGKEFSRLSSGDRDPRFGESVDPTIGWKYVRQEIELAAHGHRTLFGMERVRHESIIEGQESVAFLRRGQLTARSPVLRATRYGVISRILPPTQRRFLVNKSAVHVDERYRSLKAIGPAVIRKARQELQSVTMRSDFEQVQHLERWFRFRSLGGFSYTRLNENAGPAPIETFLFETRAGHCEFFASAMVLMLRSVGIPARVAVGFRGGTWSDRAEAFRVLQKNAHAWVEVPFEGAGWVPFDPTPPESVLDLRAPGGGAGPNLASGLETGLPPAAPEESAVDHEESTTETWLALGGAAIVVFGAWFLRSRPGFRRLWGSTSRGLAGGLQARLLRLLAKVGVRDRRSATLQELLQEAPSLPEGALPALSGVVALLYRDRYGGRPLEGSESIRLGQVLDDVERRLDT